ncbi:hypothetical protein AVI51_11195 [Piscirickettsia salmonis]|uniref:Glycosyl transferases group 1 n=1 Tax=Piscirickettsia salmonis TaxID=1238 RepID=A0A9Q5YL67_PISSA|nr:glycosyltransferase family 1 protein [Piscirickettsia salmonis]ALA26422.1 glycosyl transferase group 1 family protein [Piscirickettsia salmonis]APS43847.1 hypothetical protein AVI48_05305 [Piscirickettsia salmonis]APS47201.1 hypothetical protein AVI49_05905 [Piscirickettsia salmonis]APS51359.1 hypothetical protein AVI50_11310 [Piscirickettsia salmonis]APS54568.1 hypothetical protein AVI51_11195 [Piscirickettsia salmonis]
MKIVIDARELDGRFRGVGVFIKGILEAISTFDRDNSYVLLMRDVKTLSKLKLSNNFSSYVVPGMIGVTDIVILPYMVNKVLKPDVLWCPSNNCFPFISKKITIVSSIHDLMFFKYSYKFLSKQYFGSIYRKIFSTIAAKRANLIHTPTRNNISEISEVLGVDKNNCFYTYEGINFIEKADHAILDQLSLRGVRYIYSVAGLSPNKNFDMYLQSYRQLNRLPGMQDIKLVLSGCTKMQYQNLGPGIIITDYITDDQKKSLFKNCCLYLSLSSEEGFGLPVLEAVYYNCLNILISDIDNYKEIYEDYVSYTSINNGPEIVANNIRQLLEEPSTLKDRTRLISKCDWDNVGHILLDKFNMLVGSKI